MKISKLLLCFNPVYAGFSFSTVITDYIDIIDPYDAFQSRLCGIIAGLSAIRTRGLHWFFRNDFGYSIINVPK